MAKSMFVSNKIKNSSNKIKATWRAIKEASGKSNERNNSFCLIHNDKVHEKDADVANIFNDFFARIPVTTTFNLESSSVDAERLLHSSVIHCNVLFSFEYIYPIDVIQSFQSLEAKNTGDFWGISVRIVKSIIDIVAPYLCDIFNKCVDSGTFPDMMKHSKIIPLFKSGCKTDPSNYRPISILPAFSKIFERIILKQLLKHFNKNSLFHYNQYGFTKGRSTTDAGVALLKHIYSAWESHQNAIGVFCDLSKAFDCVCHDTLIRKLRHYGVQGNALDVITSYLDNRIQCVEINGTKSPGLPTQLGVPQGSILGPFLFLIYINDLPFYLENICDVVLFADDTSLLFKVDRNRERFDEVNSALTQVTKWFTVNNLVLNAKKTKCVKFTLPNVKDLGSSVALNKEVLETIPSTVFLGITLDSKLQWGAHISYLSARLSSAAYAVRKVRSLTDIDTARLVYYSYFHSVMSYGILLWGRAAEIESIFILQKRAIRAIYQLGTRVSLREKFKDTGILTVASQYILQNIIQVRKHIHLYTKHSDVHNLNTRNKHKLNVPYFRLQKVHGSFMSLGIRFYNKLPLHIIEMPYNSFKATVKDKLILKAYYTVGDYLNDKDPWG